MIIKLLKAGLLKGYIEDLKAGRKPRIYDEDEELIDEMAPLLHLVRLQLVKDGETPINQPNQEKIARLKSSIHRRIKKLKEAEK